MKMTGYRQAIPQLPVKPQSEPVFSYRQLALQAFQGANQQLW